MIFGIDIQKGNVRSSTVHPRFCLVKVDGGNIVSEEKDISIPRLFRILQAEVPDILAVDSVQEIAPDDAGLYRFLSSLPPETKLVQVTGDCVKMESLPVIAARYNLKFDKTNPMEEARASALIASYGGGYEVLAFEGMTTITISRARSLGRGGWSQNRYARKIHGGVKVRAREIVAKLAEAGLSYTVEAQRAFGGESRTTILVSAPRKDVPVSQEKAGDVRVRVLPKMRDKISYVPLARRPLYLIAGVDPGTTVGLAVLDLNGNLLHLESVRAQSGAEVISVINSLGIPVVVATDKAEMPAGVEKIRRAFSAVGWTPKKDILIKEKYAADEGYEYHDDHQRDALSAALMAYRSYQPKFENLRNRIPAGTDIDFVRAGIIRGKSVEQILVSRVGEEKTEEGTEVPLVRVFDEKDLEIGRLEEEVQKLRKLSSDLSKELEGKDQAVRSLQRRLSKERGERTAAVLASEEIVTRDKELEQVKKALRKEERRCKNLRERLDRMKRYISLQAGDGFLAMKVLQLLARDHLKSMHEEMGVNEDDILYILKIDGWGKTVLHDMQDAKIKAVILPHHTFNKAKEQHLIDEFREMNIPLLDGVHLSPRVRGKIGVVNEASLHSAVTEWNRAQKIYQKEKTSTEIHGMVSEYQVQRRRDVENFGIDPKTLPFNQKPVVVNNPPVPPVENKPVVLSSVPVEKEPVISPELVESEPAVSPEPAEDVLTSVLSSYREERKKELM